ncbi:hypothetical protein M8J77_019081 [Diaphorina citri]|nr:hypothetical protein M8J77_019081 [Diaphorina citri]
MTFTYKKGKIEYTYTIDNIPTQEISSIKDLGVTVSNNLSWKEHIENTTKKSYSILGCIIRHCDRIHDMDAILLLYKSLPRVKRFKNMSAIEEGLNSPAYLSWRKLQLSRAKLKASSKTSALLSGFAMVAMVEVQLGNDSKVPQGMLIAFAICTTLLVAVHMLALMISTCILPNIDAVCNLHSISLVHESPHERLHWYIETAWAFSTLLGLVLFLLEIAILCWVKFYDISEYAAWSASIILIPVLVIFLAFAVHFYRSLVAHKYEVTVSGIRELELLKQQIEAGDAENRGLNNGVNLLESNTQVV